MSRPPPIKPHQIPLVLSMQRGKQQERRVSGRATMISVQQAPDRDINVTHFFMLPTCFIYEDRPSGWLSEVRKSGQIEGIKKKHILGTELEREEMGLWR